MDKKVRNILQYAFWGLVAMVLVCLCLRSIDWSQFSEALKRCRWEYVVLSMLLGALVLWVRGRRWRMLLLPFDPGTSPVTTFNAYSICMAVNLALPRAGEVARLGYAVRHSAVGPDGKRLLGFDKALGTLFAERIWDTFVTLAMATVLLAMLWKRFGACLLEGLSSLGGAGLIGWGLGGLALLGLLSLYLIYAFRRKDGLWSKAWGFVRGIGSGAAAFLKMKRAWLFFVYTLVIWLLYWLMSSSIVLAVQDIGTFSRLTPADAFILMVAGSISSVVPVPGGFGAYHGVVCGVLSTLWGIPMGTGMIFATLNHESQVVTQALCGLASYIHEHFFRKK